MMKFASALAMSALPVATAASERTEPQDSYRMWAEPVISETGGLADVLRDTEFRLDTSNPSYFFTDLSVMFSSQEDTTAKK